MEEIKKIKRRYRRAPSIKQIKTLQLINEGWPAGRAMKAAGYSPKHAHKARKFFMNQLAVKDALESMKEKILDAGLSQDYMVNKMKEWLEAEKVHTSHTEPDYKVPDYGTQLRGFRIWHDIMKEAELPKEDGNKGRVRRKITLEEFITDESNEKKNGE